MPFADEDLDKILDYATEFVQESREQYAEHYKIIEKYCSKKSLILGGGMIKDMILDNPILNPVYEIYASDAIGDIARDIAHELLTVPYKGEYAGDNKGQTPLITYKKNMDGSYMIIIGVMIMAKIVYNDRVYKSGMTQKIQGLYSDEQLLVFDNTILLGLTLYHNFSPQYDIDETAVEQLSTPILKSTSKIEGYNYYTKIRHDYDKKLVNEVLPLISDRWSLCGEKAILALAGQEIVGRARLQIIYDGKIRNIHDLLKTHINDGIYFSEQVIHFPELPLLKKYAFHIPDSGHVLDVFNLPMFSAVPVIKTKHKIGICSPPALAFLRIIDMWSLALAGLRDVSFGIYENLYYVLSKIDDTSYPIAHKKYIGNCVNIMSLIQKSREEFHFPYFESK